MIPTAPQAESIPPGSRLGSYVVRGVIGRGGMSVVYEAEHGALGRRVALKVLRAPATGDGRPATRFLREARIVSRIRHPNVVSVFDIGAHDDVLFLAMDLLEGEDMAAALARRGALAIDEIARLFVPVFSAVGCAHRLGIVHRDLKPSNVFLARTRPHRTEPMVLDFGISKIAEHEPSAGGQGVGDLTDSLMLLGTMPYLSPEQTRSATAASERSDQYALGVMMYECASGRPPFAGSSAYDLMHAIVTTPVPLLHRIDAAVPKVFAEIVARAMDRDPDRRFASVADLARAVLPFADAMTQAAWGADLASGPPPNGETTLAETGGALDAEWHAGAHTKPAARAPLRRRWGRAGAIITLAAAAAAFVIKVAGRQGGDADPAVRPPLSVAPARAVASPAPSDPLPALTQEAETRSAVASADARPAARAATLLDGRRARRRGHADVTPARAEVGGASPAAAPAAVTVPRETGTNDVLILPP